MHTNPQTTDDKPYSVDEFCKSVGCGRTFTYGEINAGRLIAHKVGRLTKILPSSRKAWLNNLPKINAGAA
jgi:excisionase family DNA binding protein